MTGAGGEPPAGGGHAWDRLREQRAKDLGEEPVDDAREGTGSGPEDREDENEAAQNDEAENDEQGK